VKRALAAGLLWVAAAAAAADLNDLIVQAASRASPGTYARSWRGEPLYWTVVGAPDGEHEALLSEDGALEPRRGGFSLEPFLWVDGKRITAADAARSQSLEADELPIPSVEWRHRSARLFVQAFAADDAAAFVRYRVENPRPERARVELWLALRPMQVLPRWQFLNLAPGFAPIHEISRDGNRVWVDRSLALEARTPPDGFGAAASQLATPAAYLGPALEGGVLPDDARVHDANGLAAGALAWRFTLAPGAAREVDVCVPLNARRAATVCSPQEPAAALADTTAAWRQRLGRVELELPSTAADVEHTVRAALAHVLVNRDGPRLQPGSRNYERSWIRDGALTSSALVQLGHADAARDFLAWYTRFQLDGGAIPCCVDARGADPTPEHDSNGAFLYALGEYARHTGDGAFVSALWPRVVHAVGWLEALRSQRLDPRFRTERGGATYGILPESISHEGYAKKAVHSYWDDLFARQGLRDAVFLAKLVGDEAHAAAWAALSADFERDLLASYEATRKLHGIPHLAGSVELGDFDPTATAVAFEMGGEPRDFPAEALRATFARYLGEVAERKRGVMRRDAFAPYELRIATALVRMGDRDGATDVLALNLAGRRPLAWRQWPEIVWTDGTKGQWLGDLPHGWIASTFLHAVRTMLVHERASDEALVLAAGVPAAWLAGGEALRVARLSTWWGPLDYELRRAEDGTLRMRVGGGLRVPPGGIVLTPPGAKPLTLRALPADVTLH
jgi:hypothetical protein